MSEEKTLIELAKEVKKTSGKEAALDFLFASEVDLNSDLAGYLERIKIYSVGSKKYSQSALLGVFDQIITKMPEGDIWKGYSQKADLLERCGLKEDALINYRLAISNLSPYDDTYLLSLATLQRNFADLCGKDEDYIFWTLVSDLVMSAWDLSCCMNGCVERWLMHLDSNYYPYPVIKSSFDFYLGPVGVFGNGFDDSRLEESLLSFNPIKSSPFYKKRIIKMIKIDYPEKLGFKKEYFESDFSDDDFYNGILQVYPKDFVNAFSSKAVTIASDIVNEFLKEVSSD